MEKRKTKHSISRAEVGVSHPTSHSSEVDGVVPGEGEAGKVVGTQETPGEMFMGYPISVYCIVGNEFCERFSFYGLKALLPLYFRDFLRIENEDIATALVHTFIFFAYFFSILGGFLSDSYFGKYRVILWLSVVYCIGSSITSLTAIPGIMGVPPELWGAAIGLILTALGTGGIKSCVSSFVGDQFVKGQEHLLDRVFAIFYFAINSGSLCSTLITPLLRSNYGYAVAFSVPAALIILATMIFVAGSEFYRNVPPGGNVFSLFYGVIKAAFVGRARASASGKYPQRKSFFNYAIGPYSAKVVNDVARTMKVFTVFVPLPVFWSLYDQHSSRWIYQADRMDRNVFGWEVKPDQVPVLNPLLILTMIPLFNNVIYPGLERRGIILKPLEHRMAIGMGLTALSFILSGIVEFFIDYYGSGKVYFLWQLPQYVVMGAAEIMVSVTGLEFAYSQAPKSMKSIVMSGWLMTTAVGNLLVIAIAAMDFVTSDYGLQLFFFALLMLIFLLVFLWIIHDFQYKKAFEDDVEEEVEDDEVYLDVYMTSEVEEPDSFDVFQKPDGASELDAQPQDGRDSRDRSNSYGSIVI